MKIEIKSRMKYVDFILAESTLTWMKYVDYILIKSKSDLNFFISFYPSHNMGISVHFPEHFLKYNTRCDPSLLEK